MGHALTVLTLVQAGTSFTAVFRVVWFNQLEPRRHMFKAGTVCAVMLFGWWFGTFFIFPYIGDNHPN